MHAAPPVNRRPARKAPPVNRRPARKAPPVNRRPAHALLPALLALTASPAQADPGATHLGFALGTHATITDWDAAFTDHDGRRVSPGIDPLFRLRLGYTATRWLTLEAAASHIPLVLEDRLGTALLYDLDLLIPLAHAALADSTAITPRALIGAGVYHVFGPKTGPDLDLQAHYGLDLHAPLTPHIALRAGFRHLFADSLDAGLAASSHVEITLGFDLTWAAPTPPPSATSTRQAAKVSTPSDRRNAR